MSERIPEERERLYELALDSWGEEAQMNKAAEEFAEASAALNRALNGQANAAEICEELADVRLMLEQMEYTLFAESNVDSEIDDARRDLAKRLVTHGDADE